MNYGRDRQQSCNARIFLTWMRLQVRLHGKLRVFLFASGIGNVFRKLPPQFVLMGPLGLRTSTWSFEGSMMCFLCKSIELADWAFYEIFHAHRRLAPRGGLLSLLLIGMSLHLVQDIFFAFFAEWGDMLRPTVLRIALLRRVLMVQKLYVGKLPPLRSSLGSRLGPLH